MQKSTEKTGESEHNTDCDVTVRITNSYAPKICINPPMLYASRTISSPAGIVKKQARTTEKMADDGNKCYVTVAYYLSVALAHPLHLNVTV